MVIPEDQRGTETDGLVTTAPQYHTWKKSRVRLEVGDLGVSSRCHLPHCSFLQAPMLLSPLSLPLPTLFSPSLLIFNFICWFSFFF